MPAQGVRSGHPISTGLSAGLPHKRLLSLLMAATLEQTRLLTVEGLAREFQSETEARLSYYSAHPEEIEQRLRELDEEWDIDRATEIEAAGTILTGAVLGMTLSKKWFLLCAFSSAMMLMRTFTGVYPMLPLFRRLGFRTAREIEQEHYALKLLRGDFEAVARSEGKQKPRAAFEAARANGGGVEDSGAPSI
jgi:hypothetical protein